MASTLGTTGSPWRPRFLSTTCLASAPNSGASPRAKVQCWRLVQGWGDTTVVSSFGKEAEYLESIWWDGGGGGGWGCYWEICWFLWGVVEVEAMATASHIHATFRKSALTVQAVSNWLRYLLCVCKQLVEINHYSTTHALLLNGRTCTYPS